LDWPADPDLYRDIAQAQTIADGSLLDDPYYRGETQWHNPLAPLAVAGLSTLFGLPVPSTYVRAGAYLNLLGPIAFYLWVARMAGAVGATVATFGFVFYRDPWAPGWVTAAYSPWLFAMTSSQGPFYFTLTAYRSALLRDGTLRYAASGLLLGLTFLAAAPPAFILAGVVVAGGVALSAGWLPSPFAAERAQPRLLAWTHHAVLALVAAVVSAPLLYSIVGRYHLHVLNAAPTNWEWAGMQGFTDFARAHFGWPALVAVVGAWTLARGARVDALVVAAFAATAAGFLSHRHLLAQAGITVPQYVPSHYFVFYLKGLQWALVGAAAAWANAWLSSKVLVRPAWARTAAIAVLLIALVAVLPQYRTRGYFGSSREGAMAEADEPHRRAAYDWIRARTSPHDVFLASPDVALEVVGPAGRKVVVAGEVYSSPYVDWSARLRSSQWMSRALRDGDGPAFRSLARASGVRYVINARQERPWLDDLLAEQRTPGLVPAFKSGGVRIYRVAEP
jgi:hypothetical protein